MKINKNELGAFNNETPDYGFGCFGGYDNRRKEIASDSKEKSFTGKSHVILTLMDNGWNSEFGKPVHVKPTLTIEEFSEYAAEVENILSDPSYQSVIIDMINNNIENFWKYKKLGSTWIETKDEALQNAESYIEEAFLKVGIEISEYYKIEVFGSEMSTPQFSIGSISGEQMKSCQAYSTIIHLAVPYIHKKIEDDMKPFIESDVIKVENDVMMLKMLLKKYPNYKDLLENISA